ncbi:MAG: DUF1804 family protein [Porticoccus sp.]|nr:DUF1804 family protein [Porticoccus sp.]
MAYSDKLKAEVRSSFIRGESLAAVADRHEVLYDTARSWKRKAAAEGDDWDTARAASRISAGGIKTLTTEVIEDFVYLFQTTITEIKKAEDIGPLKKAEAISRLSDAFQKTVKAAGASNPELSRLAIAMDVLQRQAKFIQRHYPEQKELFLAILEPFGRELSRVYG